MPVRNAITLKEEESDKQKIDFKKKKSPGIMKMIFRRFFCFCGSGADPIYDFLIDSAQFITDLIAAGSKQIFMGANGVFF